MALSRSLQSQPVLEQLSSIFIFTPTTQCTVSVKLVMKGNVIKISVILLTKIKLGKNLKHDVNTPSRLLQSVRSH